MHGTYHLFNVSIMIESVSELSVWFCSCSFVLVTVNCVFLAVTIINRFVFLFFVNTDACRHMSHSNLNLDCRQGCQWESHDMSKVIILKRVYHLDPSIGLPKVHPLSKQASSSIPKPPCSNWLSGLPLPPSYPRVRVTLRVTTTDWAPSIRSPVHFFFN